MASQPNAGYLEVHSFPIDKYTTHPLKLENGMAVAPDTPGVGVEFKTERLLPYLVKHS